MSLTCSILVDDKRTIEDIELTPPGDASFNAIPNGTCLQLLSIVETARIPLCLMVGSPLLIASSNVNTQHWFRDLLLQRTSADSETCAIPWWDTARQDSSLGILVAIAEAKAKLPKSIPRVTELLFYASQSHHVHPGDSDSLAPSTATGEDGRQTTLGIYAVALSSDLLQQTQSGLTPPPSPKAEDAEIAATFLPSVFSVDASVVNEPPVRKRKSATDVFDEASERRKKTRRKGGEGVPATAATKVDSQPGTLQHRRRDSLSQPTQFQTRPLSRSPSVSSSRPPTAVPSGTRASTLSRVQSVSAISDTSDVETQNKNIISRIVMAGMRLYGLSQSKTRKSRASSLAPSPTVDASFEDMDTERKNDEEFKLIYHQAFKGTCFAFRNAIDKRNLQASSEAIRDAADKLLGMFCNNPLDNFASSGLTG